jgi:C4-dicarboxylate-specific signal transduction histidine kinase
VTKSWFIRRGFLAGNGLLVLAGTPCPIEGCPCQKTFQTHQSSELELFHAGSGKWLLLSTHPIPDAAGNVTGAIHVTRDITEAKRAEGELLRQRAELAHVARVSTMGELAASMAHELNQPLGAILANAEAAELFLQQDPPALDDLRVILVDIRKDDERAGEVIRRMHALLRKRELKRLPIAINALVDEVLQLVSGDAALRGVSLTADLGPALPHVSGDRVHLLQVLLNLILNGMDALAAQPRERRRISVRTRLGAEGQVEVGVTDWGHGIEPSNLPRLFEPFYTTKPNGMGMGLPVSKTIIDAHKGRIWAENHVAGGAVFRIALPVAREGPKP